MPPRRDLRLVALALALALSACEGSLDVAPDAATEAAADAPTDASTDASGPPSPDARDDAPLPLPDADADPPPPDADADLPGPPGLPEHCDGALALPIPGCRPARLPTTGDPYEDCVRRINQFRGECQCLGPLERWREGESCADDQAEYDGMGGGAHAGFRASICSPRGSAQNECPGYRDFDQVIGLCLQQMWDEGPGTPFIEHGHYLNMTDPSNRRVACGFYTTGSGRVWSVQNFSR